MFKRFGCPSRWAMLAALLCVSSLSACAPAAPPPVASPDESRTFHHSGKTELHYDNFHGNQIVYFAPGGRVYLWYPTNRIALAGEWRMDDGDLCARYDNSYNPATGDYGDDWECRPVETRERTLVDVVDGDVFGISTERIPYRLPVHPRFGSIAAVKPAPP